MSESAGSPALRDENERGDDGPLPDGVVETGAAEAGAAGAVTAVSEDTERRRVRRTLGVLAAVALTVIALDQLTKALAVAHIDPQNPVRIIGDTVTLTLVRNSGAAFSMATGYTWVLTLVALVVVIGILRYASRLVSTWWIVGIALVLGGAIGNLIDRMLRSPGPLRGHVVDFVSVGWWPVFNVADSDVVCGAILLVGLSVLGYEYDGSRTGFAARRESGDDDA